MPKNVTARDIMTTRIITLTPQMNVMEAVAIMLRHKIPGAPVLEDGALVGMVSELDCVNHMCNRAVEQLPPLEISQLMSRELLTVSPDTKLFTLADLFTTKRYRRLPVVDTQGKLLGQVSRRDILHALHGIMQFHQDPSRAPLYLSALMDEAPAVVRP